MRGQIMKGMVLCIVLAVCLMGCMTSNIITQGAAPIADTMEQAYKRGVPTAQKALSVWPFISGIVKTVLATEWNKDTHAAYVLCQQLDKTAAKYKNDPKSVTDEEYGVVNAQLIDLEIKGGTAFYNKYGKTIIEFIKALAA